VNLVETISAVINVLPEPIFVLTTQGIVATMNGHAARLLGRTPKEDAGFDLAESVQDEQEKFLAYLQLCSRTRGMMFGVLSFKSAHLPPVSYRCEGALLQPAQDGAPALVMLRAMPREHASARFVILNEKLDALGKEVSRRTKAEEIARNSEERLRFAQQAASLGSWEWNLETDEVWWSDEICSLHGLPRGSLHPTRDAWINFIVPDDREAVRRSMLIASQQGTKYEVEYRTQCPDGSQRWIAARGQVVGGANGRPAKLMGVAIDVSRQKLAEESLIKNEKLATVGRLAATIAHEINNPLAGVTNLLYLLRTNESLDATAREYLALAEQELGRVTHISNQALGFYRDTKAPVPIDLGKALRDIVALYQGRLSAKNIKVDIRCELKVEVIALAGEIRQVMSNLIVNAIDAMPPGGILGVRSRRSREWKNGGIAGVRFTIADTGCGINSEQRKNLFEPFYTTKQDVGTGLGLWISKQLIEKHSGSIRFRSSVRSPKHGTAFSVFLPQGEKCAEERLPELHAKSS
jgi:PAS domain S-box-containing protein